MTGPLEGVRVMDVGTAGVGPWAATLLGLLGADVLKIESPAGDRHLYQPPLQKGLSTTYTSLNLNKRAAMMDLKDPEARPAVERMVRQADVIMDNLRPGVVDRMGVGFEAARRINPQIVSASSPAWGEQGPLKDLPAFDPQVQMFSGFASLNGARGGKREMLRYPHLDFNASCYFASTVPAGAAGPRTDRAGPARYIQPLRQCRYFADEQSSGVFHNREGAGADGEWLHRHRSAPVLLVPGRQIPGSRSGDRGAVAESL